MEWTSGESGEARLTDDIAKHAKTHAVGRTRMQPCTAQRTNHGSKHGAISRRLGEEPVLEWKSGEYGDAYLGGESIVNGIVKGNESIDYSI